MQANFKLDATGIFRPSERIPGYDAIARDEIDSRNDAMLGFEDDLCGLKVKPLTWRHLLWLDIYQSVFLWDLTPEQLIKVPDIHLHVARFMWVCSPKWKPFSKVARWIFFRRYRKTLYGKANNTEEIVKAIHKFVDDSLWDLKSDGSSGGSRKSYFSGAASVCHMLCEKYGSLSPDPKSMNAAIDLPLRIIGQLLRVSIKSENPKALLSNRTDELERQWLVELNKTFRKN